MWGMLALCQVWTWASHVWLIQVAQNHGRAVASGIAGKPLVFDKTPVFWSAQGQQLRYVGNGTGFDDVLVKGDPSELKVCV